MRITSLFPPVRNFFLSFLPLPPPLPGLVSDCPLVEYIPETCAPYTTDNDGLWTSWLVAAEAFRYQVTRDPAAQITASALFQGMQFLVNVRAWEERGRGYPYRHSS